MTACPKCQSNKVTKRYFAVGDWCKAIVEHYRYFCSDCGHQWPTIGLSFAANESFTATGKNIVSPSGISEMQSALGSKSQSAEVLMLEAAEKIKEHFTLSSRVEFLEAVCRSSEETMQRWQKENQKLRDEVENLRIENTALRNQIARDVGVAASREINYLRAKVKQLEAANIALVTKGTVWERENVPEDIRDLVAQGMSPTEADLMNHWGSSLEATKKLCKILGRKAPSRLRNATDILEKHIIPLIEGGRLDHIAKTMKENEKLKQENEELTGALNNWAASEKKLKEDIESCTAREDERRKRLSDLVAEWRRDARIWVSPIASLYRECANELEKLI